MSKVLENRAALRHVHGIVEDIENRMEGIEATSKANQETTLIKSDAINTSIVSLRSLGE